MNWYFWCETRGITIQGNSDVITRGTAQGPVLVGLGDVCIGLQQRSCYSLLALCVVASDTILHVEL